MDRFLLDHLVSPLMLIVFTIATLCFIAGARPEPIVRGFFDLGIALVAGLFQLMKSLILAIFHLPGSGRKRPLPRLLTGKEHQRYEILPNDRRNRD